MRGTRPKRDWAHVVSGIGKRARAGTPQDQRRPNPVTPTGKLPTAHGSSKTETSAQPRPRAALGGAAPRESRGVAAGRAAIRLRSAPPRCMPALSSWT